MGENILFQLLIQFIIVSGGNSNTGSKETEVDTAASTSTSQSVVAVSNLSSLNENAGGISDSESEEDSNHSADILPLQEELLQDSTSQHTVLLSETASSVNSDTLILPSTSSNMVPDAEIPSSSHAVSSTAQSNSAIQLISSQQTNRGAKRPLEDHETSPGLGNKQRRSGGEIAQENVFAATLDRLEDLSDKAIMLGSHDDDLDNFGKYVASLLRGLPSERATELQKEVIDLILKSHVKDEPDSSEVDPLALEEQLPPQSSSDTTQTTTVQRKNFEDIISASRRLVEKSRTTNVQQTNEVNGRSSGKLASSGQNADSTLLQRNNTSEKRLLPDESPANDETECDDPVLETKRVDAALKRLECISEKVNMLSEKDDNFDTFGKYVASLLRYISAEKAVELQQELINLILKARANTKT
ncbi:hypothetical protein C0J52_24954 [Blattella germanica]|nr:hypothetical protein C0J52_24954 [Blattella germanica]